MCIRDSLKRGLKAVGFHITESNSAIIPVMLYDAKKAQKMAELLLKEGIYVIGFFYPVVPKNQARIRLQLSASHKKLHLDKLIDAFKRVGEVLDIIGK